MNSTYGEMKSAHRILVGKSERKKPHLGVDGMIILKQILES
jgi:hypothetical protein